MCMYPQYVPTWKASTIGKKETRTKFHPDGYGYSKDYDNLQERPCGKCPECRKLRACHWSFRLQQHAKYQHNGMFLTLTYDNEHLPYRGGEPSLKRMDARNFMKRLRKRRETIYTRKKQPDFNKYGDRKQAFIDQYNDIKGSKMTYFLIGEYGTSETERPHYHALIWNIPRPLYQEIPDIWGKGNIKVGTVTEKSIRYVSNYIMGTVPEDERVVEPEYANMSQGLGIDYLVENETRHRKTYEPPTVRYNDREITMPKYYRDKIYIPEEKERLGELAKNAWQERVKEQEQLLKEKGIDPEDYKRDKDVATWRKFRKHKKYKNYKL